MRYNMQLLINDHPVDFAVEKETTVKDIMGSILNWASERSLVFSGAIIDGTVYQLDNAPDISIEKVDNINCYVQSVSDIVIDSIKEGIAYCNRACQHLENKSNTSLSADELLQLQNGFEWIVSVLQSVLHMLGLERDDLRFKDMTVQEFIGSVYSFGHNISSSTDINLLTTANNILHDTMTLFRVLLCSDALKSLVVQSVDSPDVLFQTLVELKGMVQKQVKNLEEIAGLYQKGNDSEALEIIHTLVDFLYLYMRTCYQVSPVFNINIAEFIYNGQSLEELNIKIQDLLTEIVSVMENNDVVSLSDILEYELKPLIDEIDHYIDILLQNIKS